MFIITLYKYLYISAPSSFYHHLYPVSHLTTFPFWHPQFLIALHWLSPNGFFCPPSTDTEHIYMLLAFNPPSDLHLLLYFHFVSSSLCSAIHPPKDLNPWLFSVYLYTAVFFLTKLITAPWRWRFFWNTGEFIPDYKVSYPT